MRPWRSGQRAAHLVEVMQLAQNPGVPFLALLHIICVCVCVFKPHIFFLMVRVKINKKQTLKNYGEYCSFLFDHNLHDACFGELLVLRNLLFL